MKKNNFIDKIVMFKKNNPVLTMFIVGNFLNAILLRLFTTGKFQVRSIFCDLSIVFLLGALSFLIKKNRRNKYFCIISFILVFVCMANSLYYNYYSSFVSVSLLATSVFVKDVGDAVVDMVVRLCDLTYLWLFVGLFLVIRKNNNEYIVNKKKFLKMLLLSFYMLCIGCAIPPYNSYSRLYKNRPSAALHRGYYD